jgi:hypothetical protein
MISDMKFGPDGALYVISLMEGKIYRITLGWFFKNRLNDRKKIKIANNAFFDFIFKIRIKGVF